MNWRRFEDLEGFREQLAAALVAAALGSELHPVYSDGADSSPDTYLDCCPRCGEQLEFELPPGHRPSREHPWWFKCGSCVARAPCDLFRVRYGR